jgi:large subunit ribosomal protein L28
MWQNSCLCGAFTALFVRLKPDQRIFAMSKRCAISGKTTSFGRNVSFSKRRTNRRFMSNIHYKNLYVPELGVTIRCQLSTHAIRTIDKKGLAAYLKDEGKTIRDLI